METKVLSVERLGESAVEQAARLLSKGELVAFPTETVYGVGAVMSREEAVRKVFAVKGRPLDNPLIVHVASVEMAQALIAASEDRFNRLVQHFWPGPLTVIVHHSGNVPAIVTAGLPTVALRMPNHPVALQLIEGVKEPIVAPSANRSGRPSPTRAEHVLEDLQGKIAAVLDAGPVTIGIESTVLLLTVTPPRIVRPGTITKAEIEQVLGEEIQEELLPSSNAVPLSPGMKYRHYAPSIPILVFNEFTELQRCWQQRKRESTQQILVLARSSWKDPIQKLGLEFALLSEQTLYAIFRQAERRKLEAIWILCDPQVRQRTGLYNRILKAAGISRSGSGRRSDTPLQKVD